MTTEILNTHDIIASEGYRIAPSLKERVLEAAKLFNEGITGTNSFAVSRLSEAFTTSDFPILLGKAFDIEVLRAYKDTVPEWSSIAPEHKVQDFSEQTLIDIFGGKDVLDDVAEGEEYKSRKLSESEIKVRTGKTGNTFDLTWELRKNRRFYELANFPARLGQAARVTEDQKVFEVFVSSTGPKASYFNAANGNAPSNKILNEANLLAAYKTVIGRKNKDGNPVNLVGRRLNLVVPQSLQFEAEALVNEPVVSAGGTATKKNPLFGKFNVVVSYRISIIDTSANSATTWYLLPPKEVERPAFVRVAMIGEEQPDIRVERNQGERVGGGTVSFDDGSFKDDTIHFRGRHVTGGASVDPLATYASTGTTA